VADVAALGWGVWIFCAAAVFAGAILQRLAGQGFGLLAAPLMALAAPQFLPATLLMLGLVVGFGSVAVDRSAISVPELPAGFLGRALGAAIAAVIAMSLPDPQSLAVVVAGTVYLGIALSVVGLRVSIRGSSLFGAGLVAGVMGTLTAVGAPPMALLYQHEEARRSATMQNIFFAWGMLVSILALVLVGLIGWRHLAFAASLAPVVLVALWLAQPMAARVAKARIRPWALCLSGLAATALIARQVL